MDEDSYIKKVLNESPLMRHLFNKIGKRVKVVKDAKTEIIGTLRAIDIPRKYIEVHEFERSKVHFFNMRAIIDVESEDIIEKRRNDA